MKEDARCPDSLHDLLLSFLCHLEGFSAGPASFLQLLQRVLALHSISFATCKDVTVVIENTTASEPDVPEVQVTSGISATKLTP